MSPAQAPLCSRGKGWPAMACGAPRPPRCPNVLLSRRSPGRRCGPPPLPRTCPATHVGRPTARSPARAATCTRHPVAGPAGELDAQGKRDAHWVGTGHRHLDIGTALPACEHEDRGCYSACVAAAASAIAQSHRRTAAPYMARRGTNTAVHRAARKAAYGPFSRGIARPCILRKPTGSGYWHKGGHG